MHTTGRTLMSQYTNTLQYSQLQKRLNSSRNGKGLGGVNPTGVLSGLGGISHFKRSLYSKVSPYQRLCFDSNSIFNSCFVCDKLSIILPTPLFTISSPVALNGCYNPAHYLSQLCGRVYTTSYTHEDYERMLGSGGRALTSGVCRYHYQLS